MMFEVNSCVMYGRTGVCQVTEIKSGDFIGKPDSKYYILHPVFSSDVAIMLPVDNQKTSMRTLASKQEIFSLIDSLPDSEIVWEDDDKLRIKKFTDALNSGLCEEWIILIKSIKSKIAEKKAIGKKLSQIDENILKDAKKLLYEEFSQSLGLMPEDIEAFIIERISQRTDKEIWI